MSRPSLAEASQMERLELASMLLADAQIAAGVLAVRVKQMQNRLGMQHRDLGNGALSELARIIDNCDNAHELLGQELAVHQDERTKKNGGEGHG